MVIAGGETQIVITPETGYKVKQVLVDNVDVGAVTVYAFSDIDSNHTISVEFEKITLKITITSFGEGNVDCLQDLQNIEYGSDRVIKFNPKVGWILDKVIVDNNESTISNNELNLENITSNKTIQVVFVESENIESFKLDKIKVIAIAVFVLIAIVVLVVIVKRIKLKNK